MNVARIRIAWLMIFVALVALNLAAFRVALHRSDRFNELWLMGIMPMANALVVSLLVGYRRRRCHRFHLGFQAFGATSFSLSVAGKWLGTGVAGLHFRLFAEPHWLSWTTIQVASWDMIAVVIVGLLHLVFALIGGLLFRNFRIG